MNNIRNELVTLATKAIDSIFASIEVESKKLGEVKQSVGAETEKYLALRASNESVSKDTKEKLNLLRQREAEVTKQEDDLRQKQIDASVQVSRAQATLSALIKQRDIISAEINDRQKEREQIAPLTAAKETLLREIADLQTKLAVVGDEYKKAEASHLEKLSSAEKEVQTAIKERDSVLKENEELRKIWAPRIELTKQKEEELLKKEEGLRTVAARYKKLYAEKGADFLL